RFTTPAEVAAALQPFTAGAGPAPFVAAPKGPTVEMGGGAGHTGTPPPAAWGTPPGPRGRPPPGPAPPPPPPPAPPGPWPVPAPAVALAGLCLVLAAAVIAWPWFRNLTGPTGKPLAVTEMRVKHYGEGGKLLADNLLNSSLAVRLNDAVQVRAKLTAPAYYYL